jgi:hypothetical protein
VAEISCIFIQTILNSVQHYSVIGDGISSIPKILDVLPADGSDPVKNFLTIEHELAKYDQELADKPRLLAINKMDLFYFNYPSFIHRSMLLLTQTCRLLNPYSLSH